MTTTTTTTTTTDNDINLIFNCLNKCLFMYLYGCFAFSFKFYIISKNILLNSNHNSQNLFLSLIIYIIRKTSQDYIFNNCIYRHQTNVENNFLTVNFFAPSFFMCLHDNIY